MSAHVAVVGGGPAGMAAALFAAKEGASVLLLERNEKIGKKLYITGKGRCNVTNAADNMLPHIPQNPRFLYSAFSLLDAAGLRELLLSYGCPTKTERGGRVFPDSDKASDVTRALQKAMQAEGVTVRLHARVSKTELDEMLKMGPVILATGGASYPSTGSTGDGYAFAKAYGHTVYAPKPSLIPLVTREAWPKSLTGVSLKNVRLRAVVGKKTRFDELGEMLFTHFGISGPLVLAMSSHILDDPLETVDIRLDMKPGLTQEQLEQRLMRDIAEKPRKQLAGILPGLLPVKMAGIVPTLCGLDGGKAVGQISREERSALAACLKGIPLPVVGYRPMEEAIITRGGVDVREVNPKTMESRLRKGLFFAGELLDVDAHTGGYNLQIAFSTGALAGKHAGSGA